MAQDYDSGRISTAKDLQDPVSPGYVRVMLRWSL